jgi:hypothetical protein
MAREWTSQPPEMPAVRLNVTRVVQEHLQVLAHNEGLQLSQYVRRLVERDVLQHYPELIVQHPDQFTCFVPGADGGAVARDPAEIQTRKPRARKAKGANPEKGPAPKRSQKK